MIAAARPRWSRYRRGPSANAREAVNGDKKESQRQDQGKAQEDLAHRGDYPQKNQEAQKKTGEEGASPARTPAARFRYAARWRRNPHPRTHHRFQQRVESLEVNHAPVTEVGPNDDFGLKVVEHVREHDVVYKVRP